MNIEIKSGKILAEGSGVSDWLAKLLEENKEHSGMVTYGEDGPQVNKDIYNTMITDAAVPSKDEALAAAKERGLELGDEPEKRIFTMIASDERVDLHGDIVRQNWELDDYKKNPVILPGHNWSALPIGNSLIEKIVKRKTEEYTGKALQLTTLQHDLTEEAASYTRLMQAKFLRTGSVGFYPGIVIEVEDEKERAKLGLGKWGLILDKNLLKEHSIVTLPANTGAQILSLACKDGLLQGNDIQMIRECYRVTVGTKAGGQAWTQTDYQMRQMWKRLYPNVKTFKHEDPEAPIEFDKIDIGKALEDSLDKKKSSQVFNLFSTKDDDQESEIEEPVDTETDSEKDAQELLNEAVVLLSDIKSEQAAFNDRLDHIENTIQPDGGQPEGSLGEALCNSLSKNPNK